VSRIAGGTALTFVFVELAGVVLERATLGAIAVQALIAEFGAGRLAVAWSDPFAPPPSTKALAKTIGKGFLLGLFAVALVVTAALATGEARLGDAGVSLASLALGLLPAALIAMRDELLFRGMVLRAFGGSVPFPVPLVVSGLASFAAALGHEEPLLSAVNAGIVGAGLAALFWGTRALWLPRAAHAAYAWGTQTLVSGALIDVRPVATSWASSARAVDAGPFALVALAVLVTLGVASRFRTLRDTPTHYTGVSA
jgi:membrane protease YdiL (CAAX protease family)